MSDFWNSALSYFGGGSDSSGSRFIGQTVDLGEGNKLRVKKVIAEGKLSSLGKKASLRARPIFF